MSVGLFSMTANRDLTFNLSLHGGKKMKLCKQRGTSLGAQLWLSPLFVACLAVLKQTGYFVTLFMGFFFLCNRKTQFCGVVSDIRQVDPQSRSVNHSFN